MPDTVATAVTAAYNCIVEQCIAPVHRPTNVSVDPYAIPAALVVALKYLLALTGEEVLASKQLNHEKNQGSTRTQNAISAKEVQITDLKKKLATAKDIEILNKYETDKAAAKIALRQATFDLEQYLADHPNETVESETPEVVAMKGAIEAANNTLTQARKDLNAPKIIQNEINRLMAEIKKLAEPPETPTNTDLTKALEVRFAHLPTAHQPRFSEEVEAKVNDGLANLVKFVLKGLGIKNSKNEAMIKILVHLIIEAATQDGAATTTDVAQRIGEKAYAFAAIFLINTLKS